MVLVTDAAAITAAINAKFATAPVLTLKQAATATTDHILLFISRRYVADRLASGEVTIIGWRVLTRYVCKTEGNVDVFRARVRAALEDQILTGDVGPFTFETENTTTQDGDWLVSSDSWTY